MNAPDEALRDDLIEPDENGGDQGLYELVNPHDDYTFEAADDDIADAVVGLLGDMYGWQVDGRSGGMLRFVSDPEATVERIKAVLDQRAAEVANALVTVEIKADQRRRLGVDPEKWHDEMRSSTADLRASALRMATALEARADA